MLYICILSLKILLLSIHLDDNQNDKKSFECIEHFSISWKNNTFTLLLFNLTVCATASPIAFVCIVNDSHTMDWYVCRCAVTIGQQNHVWINRSIDRSMDRLHHTSLTIISSFEYVAWFVSTEAEAHKRISIYTYTYIFVTKNQIDTLTYCFLYFYCDFNRILLSLRFANAIVFFVRFAVLL